jgi:sugar phosphate isomerase/epimerase
VFVAASTHCFGDKSFQEACGLIADLEYDKIEIWLSEAGEHLKPSTVAADPDRFGVQFREMTRLTPIAIALEENVDLATVAAISKLAKSLRITQLTIPASPLGTPFNAEIDRLRSILAITNQDAIRLSLKTRAGDLTEDPNTAVELCQAVGGLGLTLDPSYYICGSRAANSYDRVFPYVYHMHLRDTSADKLQVQIGLGEVDYSRLINQLARFDYKRALSVDLFPSLTDMETRPLEMRKLRMLLESLL